MDPVTSRLVTLTALTLLACATGHPAPETAPPPPDLSGAWVYGQGQEPPPGPVTQSPRCWSGGVTFELQQQGAALTGRITWLPAAVGMPRPPMDEH